MSGRTHRGVAILLIAGLFMILPGCGGGGGGGEQAPSDYLLFYGDDSNPDSYGDGLFKVQDGALQPVMTLNATGKSHVQGLTALGERTVFTACSTSGCEPWISDGTFEGTFQLRDINPTGSSDPSGYTLFNGELYFPANDGRHGVELWKTDGTTAGTVMVANLAAEEDVASPLPVSSFPAGLTVCNGALYFVATEIDWQGYGRGRELWKSDGTAAGTVMVANLAIEDPDNPAGDPDTPVDADPHELFVFNGVLFFAADDGPYGPDKLGVELWKSDGTAAGTVLVANVGGADDYDGAPQQFTPFGSALYFFADDGVHGFEPWRTDGTSAGTVLVANLGNDDGGPFPATPANLDYLLTFDGLLYFTADDGIRGVELWRTDGVTPSLLANINPFGNSVLPGRGDLFRVFGDRLFFFANDGVHGFEPWVSDGTGPGTALLGEIYATPANLPANADRLKILTEYQGRLYFTADDGLTGREIWSSNGTAAGTQLLLDIGPGLESGYADAFGPALLDGVLYFSAFDGGITTGHGVEMWRTMGSAAETQLVADLNPGAAYDGVLKAGAMPP